jgi:RNA polymerase sigma-70 factor (ECF subfamily)
VSRDHDRDRGVLDEIEELIAGARAAWPEVDADASAFSRRVEQLVAEGATASKLHTDDLWLAVACEAGDDGAFTAFERACIEPIDRVLAHMRLPAEAVDEIKQVVRTRLLVPTADAPAKIAEYKGRGALRSWVGVIATREALGQARRVRPPPGDEALMGIESPHTGPELGYLKEHAREAFREAFTAALAELTPRARNALRHHYVHGLTIDQIAATYGVHRSNAARRIAKARDTLLAATRRRVLIALRVDRGEFESMMRMVESKLDVSLQRLLGPD